MQQPDFGQSYDEIAQGVLRKNDAHAALKREIDAELGEPGGEELTNSAEWATKTLGRTRMVTV